LFFGDSKGPKLQVQALTTAADSSETKARKLYAAVQKIRNLTYEASRSGKEWKNLNIKEAKSVSDILERKYGWGNELNLAFIALLRAANIEANQVWLVARDSGMFKPDLHDPSQLNGMVVLAKIEGKDVFLDPATPLCPYGSLPWSESGVSGLVFSAGNSRFVSVSDVGSETNKLERSVTLKVSGDDALEGEVELLYKGQPALSTRLLGLGLEDADRKKMLENWVKDALKGESTVTLLSNSDWNKSENEFRFRAHFTAPGQVTKTAKRVMFPLMIWKSPETNLATFEKRKATVYFNFAFQTIDQISIEVPGDLTLEAVPPLREEQVDVLSFKWFCSRKAPGIYCQREMGINGYLFPIEVYPTLRTFLQTVRDSDERSIILSSVAKPN
jgi:hypothetical protein